MASAWALACIAEHRFRILCRIAYGGMIARMENKTMVRVLHIPMRSFKEDWLNRFRSIALVDTQPPFRNNRFPTHQRATIVIDHHARHTKTKADFLLIDETVGATTTLLSEALFYSGLDFDRRLATAMVYGIGSETQTLGREAGTRDIQAYRLLLPKANMQWLSQIQNPPRPSSFFHTLARAICHAFISQKVIGVHLGAVPSQDIVSHMADFLLTHENVGWSLVTGRFAGELCISLRTRNPTGKAGHLLWRLLGAGTAGGGHGMIAGGAIRVGNDVSEEVWRKAEWSFTEKFLQSQGYREPFDVYYPYRDF